jgi:hypothetical protein
LFPLDAINSSKALLAIYAPIHPINFKERACFWKRQIVSSNSN